MKSALTRIHLDPADGPRVTQIVNLKLTDSSERSITKWNQNTEAPTKYSFGDLSATYALRKEELGVNHYEGKS